MLLFRKILRLHLMDGTYLDYILIYSALSRRVTDMNFIYNISFRENTYTVQINRLENKYAIKEKFMESGTELVLLTQRSTIGLSFAKKIKKCGV